MTQALKSEFRKIFTVRSTYIVMAIVLILLGLVSFYIGGFKTNGNFNDPKIFAGAVTDAINFLAIIIAIVGVLLITHEYRYNTITYTLTSAKKRSYILLAKIISISVFALLLSLFVSIMSPALMALGLHLRHISIGPQDLPVVDILWRSLFYGWGYSMLALLMATLLRNQVAAIVALFLIPTTAEQLLGLLVKESNAIYLPFRALGAVLNNDKITHTSAALVVLSYLVAGWIIALILFKRRDAN